MTIFIGVPEGSFRTFFARKIVKNLKITDSYKPRNYKKVRKYIIELAARIGFTLENYFASEIIRHFIKVPREERINTDWILVLRK